MSDLNLFLKENLSKLDEVFSELEKRIDHIQIKNFSSEEILSLYKKENKKLKEQISSEEKLIK